MRLNQYFMRTTTKDDQVEILATVLGSFVLGAASAREFLSSGTFEVRIFFLGISCFVLFLSVALVSETRPRFYDDGRRLLSLLWVAFFALACGSAIDLFSSQFFTHGASGSVPVETIVFLSSSTVSTNLLYYLNREAFLKHLRQKTLYKYLLAPINGLSLGVILGGLMVWSLS